MRNRERRKQAVRAIAVSGADALLVTHAPDVRYLSGFTGSSGALAITAGRSALFTDGRYAAQARAEADGVRVVIGNRSPALQAVEWMAAAGVKRCGFDPGQTSVAAMETMNKALPAALRRAFFVAANAPGMPGLVARLREVKDETEIARMKKAARLGCKLFDEVLEFVVPGATEAEVAAQLEFRARSAGAEAMSFETIVASGQRSALPHGRASASRLPRRGFVTMDFGVVLDGYCSDMTRTVHLGKPTSEEWDVYHSVLEAQQAAIAAIAPGVACAEVDEAARSVLRKAGLEKAFSHSTGHGVGLEIHEGPRIAARQMQTLEQGMVITVEPGAYLVEKAGKSKTQRGVFGVRIEDMVLVTRRGGEVLTAATPKMWMEL